MEFEETSAKGNGELNKVIDKDYIAQRLDEIYKRLELIDSDSAESRAASILAVCSRLFCIIACFLEMPA